MADSNITKRALANELQELMAEQPFEKINVAQICQRCHMNRKSFYYHFRDKYDLVNWIFDTEFIALITGLLLKRAAATSIKTMLFTAKRCRSRDRIPLATILKNISGRF